MVFDIYQDNAIGNVIEAIDASIEKCVEEADQIIGDYWIWVQKGNQAISEARAQAKKNGQDQNEPKGYAYTGPRIEIVQSGTGQQKKPKHTIIWSYYKREGIRTKSGESNNVRFSQMGKRIKMTANKEYNFSTLIKFSVGWDAKRMLETEKRLMPIREKLESLHKAKVELRKLNRRVNRILNKHTEESVYGD